MHDLNWDNGFKVDFNLYTGISNNIETKKRFLCDMTGFYQDKNAFEEMLKRNELIYEYYDLQAPQRDGELAFGTTIIYPGTVGNEYFMTKGHFHKKLNTAEIYYALSGEGCIVMESLQGDTKEIFIAAGEVAYVPRGYAHRSVNTGEEPFVLFYSYDANAGHDYKTIELSGFKHLICKDAGGVRVLENLHYGK